MAFGIERLRGAVDTLTEHVKGLGDSLRAGFNDARDLTLDAVTDTRSDLAGRIDGTRADLGGRIDATHRNVDELARDLGAARREIADLHALLQAWRAEAAEARNSTVQKPEPATTTAEEEPAAPEATGTTPAPTTGDQPPARPFPDSADSRTRHLDRMLDAAGIAKANLTCHRDLWSFLVEKAADQPRFHIPGKVEDDDGNVSVTLSGPNLAAALTVMWETRRTSFDHDPASVDGALANEAYEAIATAVADVRDAPRHRGQDQVTIRIDRQPGKKPPGR